MPTVTVIHRSRPGGRRVILVLLLLLAVLMLAGARNKAQARSRAARVVGVSAAALPPVTDRRAADVASELHMEMSPARPATSADSLRAADAAAQLRQALVKYQDTTAAVADGYKMFMPELKTQKVYHFTSNWHAVQEAFRFDPAKPTSILYTKDANGHFALVGAMYTVPKRFGIEKLDARVPTSIARWHKHVNWCVPKKDETERWLERKDGLPLFGPESPVASKAACSAIGGVFHETVFGWMLHANVVSGSDPAQIWGNEHAGHDMHDGMKMDPGM